jgi:hypothetical protein
MRGLILAASLVLGASSFVAPAPAALAAPAPAGYGAPTPGVGGTMVLAGPAARVRVRCGRYRCGRAAVRPARPMPPSTVPRPAAGYAPPLR